MPPADSAFAAARLPPADDRDPAVQQFPAIAATCGTLALWAVTLAHPSATRMHTGPWALIASLLWLLPVLWLLVRFVAGPRLRLPSPLVTSGLAALALATVLAAWASPFRGASLARVWPALGGVALCLLLVDGLRAAPPSSHTLRVWTIRVITFGGAALTVVSLAGWWSSNPAARNAVPFGHSTYTGGVMVMIFPWLVHAALAHRRRARAAWSAACVVAVVVIGSTSSRGAVLALGAVLGAGAVGVVAFARWPRRRKVLVLAAVAFVGLAAIWTNPRLRELVLEQRWGDSARESNRQRTAMLSAGVRLGLQRPLLGWGPGTVPLAYPRVRAELAGGVDNVLQLHSTPAQIWATLGLAGSLAGLMLVVGAASAAARIRTAPREPRASCVAAAASLGGYGIFALTDHQFDLPIVAGLAAANLALLTTGTVDARATHGPGEPAGVLRWGAVALGLALLAGPAVALARDVLARVTFDLGLGAWQRGRTERYLAALDRATRFTPHDPFFQHQAVAALLRLRQETSDPAQRDRLTRDAIARLEASLATGVHQELAHFNLGWLELGAGAPAAAVRHFTAAARLVPDKGGVYFGLGFALNAAGRRDAAIRAFALEWLNDPWHVASPAWEIPELAALRPAVMAEATRLFSDAATAHPAARAAEAWLRWWTGEAIAASVLGEGFNRESATFIAALPAIAARAPVESNALWAQLYRAWRERDFVGVAKGDADYARALARRAARHGGDFRTFLTAGTEDEPALIKTYRRQRLGYGVLALHPDGPLFTDVYSVQENRLVADFAARLFPAKGWLPGRFLLERLPENPR